MDMLVPKKLLQLTLPSAMVRYAVVYEKHTKISEAVRVAEQKVAHAQSCVMKYGGIVASPKLLRLCVLHLGMNS